MAVAIPALKTIQLTLTPKGVAVIAFNRPERYNALSPLAYRVRPPTTPLVVASNLFS